jgi:membrane-bound lytic murein transglycosylase F
MLGFEYELLRRFTRSEGLRLKVVVPPSRADLVPALLAGEGDVIAAGFAAPGPGIALSRPYRETSGVVVVRDEEGAPSSAEDLAELTVLLRRSSPYWDTMRAFQIGGAGFALEAAPEAMETEEIIAEVAAGVADATVADADILAVEQNWRDDVRTGFELPGKVAHRLGLREDDGALLAALDAFLKEEFRSLVYNVTQEKYFENPRQVSRLRAHRIDREPGGRLSPYDEIVRRVAARHGFDWPLIVSIMYQESRFDPEARSWAGARGLMQLLPRTASRFGAEQPEDPEQGITAGVGYLAWNYGLLEDELSVQDRTWLAVAAYNAGIGHLRDARRLARRLGFNPNVWFGHVERALRLLSEREHYAQAKFGYVRGSETAAYVRAIRERYQAYVALATTE